MKFWGPRFEENNKILDLSLEEICAKQWVACVKSSNKSFKKIDPERLFSLSYEDFVNRPNILILKMLEFIGINIDSDIIIPEINNSSIGKGLKKLTSFQLDEIMPIINNTMIENNYK